MEDNRFYEGQKLKAVSWYDTGRLQSGLNGCESITVVMENGEKSGVPWIIVKNENGAIYKYNLKSCDGVELFKESEDE